MKPNNYRYRIFLHVSGAFPSAQISILHLCGSFKPRCVRVTSSSPPNWQDSEHKGHSLSQSLSISCDTSSHGQILSESCASLVVLTTGFFMHVIFIGRVVCAGTRTEAQHPRNTVRMLLLSISVEYQITLLNMCRHALRSKAKHILRICVFST